MFYAGNIGFKTLPAGEGFLWLSERDGWNHIYHRAVSGKRLRQLTMGNWRVENIAAFDAEAGQVFFTGRPDPKHIYDVHVMAVPLAGGVVRQLSQGRGTHDRLLFSPDTSMFIDRFESFETPPRIELRRSDGSLIAVIDAADSSALYATGWQPPKDFTVDGTDGVAIRGVMYRPFDFDPTKRYPVIVYIYGGPQTLLSYPSFVAPGEAVGANLPLAIAQSGMFVLKIGTMGTPGRSRAFQIGIADMWGSGISGDHAEVIRALGNQHSWLDTDSASIFGHSWGRLNVLHALASHGGFFKADVASAPGFGIPALPDDGFMEAYLGSPAQPRTPRFGHGRISWRRLLISVDRCCWCPARRTTFSTCRCFVQAMSW